MTTRIDTVPYIDSLQYTPQITMKFTIAERDFFVAGESASRVKRTLQQLGLRQDIISKTSLCGMNGI